MLHTVPHIAEKYALEFVLGSKIYPPKTPNPNPNTNVYDNMVVSMYKAMWINQKEHQLTSRPLRQHTLCLLWMKKSRTELPLQLPYNVY